MESPPVRREPPAQARLRLPDLVRTVGELNDLGVSGEPSMAGNGLFFRSSFAHSVFRFSYPHAILEGDHVGGNTRDLVLSAIRMAA